MPEEIKVISEEEFITDVDNEQTDDEDQGISDITESKLTAEEQIDFLLRRRSLKQQIRILHLLK